MTMSASASAVPHGAAKYLRNAAGEFVCPHCGETKARQNTMFYHLKKHAGALDYVCSEPGCGKAFVQKSALDQHHLQAHAAGAERTAWGCPCCAHTTLTKANMVIHIGRMHAPLPVFEGGACGGCCKTMSSATAYFYHAMTCFGVPLEPVAPGAAASKATVVEAPKE
jgi:hypothetical protein